MVKGFHRLIADDAGDDVPDRMITLSAEAAEKLGLDSVEFELPPAVARMRNAFKAREARIRETYDVDPWIGCVYCEDTGRAVKRADPADQNATTGQPCACLLGEGQAEADKRDARWRAMLPERMRDYSLDSCPNHDLVIRIYDWLKTDPVKSGTGLVLVGGVGRGKTGAAIGVLRHYQQRGVSVSFLNVQEFLDQVKSGFDDDKSPAYTKALFKAERVTLLVLDDLGAERTNDWTVSVIDQLIRKRYDEFRATIITSNLHKDDFERHISPRLLSRIRETSVIIPAIGPDLRPSEPTKIDDSRGRNRQ